LFGQQSNITATNIDDVWGDYTTGDGSQVIAVLDTGVDYTHPDLEANIWINQAELNGVPDFDDDGNGFIDDIRGWDFINIDNAPLDDNMHGTHVAGIAGAVGNNSIGIAGAAWNVKLMPIKVFQSTGVGNLTTIAEGVEYASNNGATILNMSFGSYAESATLKLALENAYATAILVAAAGNNARPIGPCLGCAPMYPGAYNYILGIEDHPKPPFGYTNYDQDGPVFTRYANLLNYELTAPGTGIMSTIPGGGYAALTGTSMSTPLIAGALALYAQEKPDDSKELMFGTLINTAGSSYVDFLAAMEAVPVPELAVLSAATRDTIGGQNGNEYIEPGEIIEILPLIKNYWGFTEDVRVGIEFAPFEDQTKATIVQSEIEIGSISSYATLQDLNQTLKVQIAPGVANNVDIRFMLTAWSGPNQEYMSESVELVLTVTNAIIFDQYITEDMTLTNDVEWIFANSMVVSNGATLTIEPGTIIKMSENRRIIVDGNSRIFSNGTPEEPVVIQSAGNGYWRGVSIEGDALDFENNSQTSLQDLKLHPLMSRAKFTYTNFIGWGLEGSEFGGAVQWYGNYFVGPGVYEDCNFQEFNYGWAFLCAGGIFDRCNLRYGTFVTKMIRNNAFDNFTTIWNDSNWSNLDLSGEHNLNDVIVGYTGLLTIDERYNFPNYNGPNYRGRIGHNLFNLRALTIDWSQMTLEPEININLGSSTQGSGIFDFPSQVWVGTDNEDIIRQKFWDFTTSEVYVGTINYGTRPSGPSSGAHGIVWKVELNGVDAQDEYELLEPVGVGSHEFKVYFNRAMDTTVTPQISYGVREPYNQQIISEQGSWSADGKIYTVMHDVGVSGGDTNNVGASDGINRIRVQGARDLDYIDIPIENIRFNFLLQAAGS
ncbi:S8 family serine peptidase, partial [Flavobacteriaceae bacterium]|nr:S8 family serine peptidase [Flavobacteriaceae bacterium]